jgi:hypothetical protein
MLRRGIVYSPTWGGHHIVYQSAKKPICNLLEYVGGRGGVRASLSGHNESSSASNC